MSEPDDTKPPTTGPENGSEQDGTSGKAVPPDDGRPAAGPSLDLPLSSPD